MWIEAMDAVLGFSLENHSWRSLSLHAMLKPLERRATQGVTPDL
jgi:hypothetical protein